MPTPTEITKPYMKYCEIHDVHCCCPKCDEFKDCRRGSFDCKDCKPTEDIDNLCHSRYKTINPQYPQIQKEYELYKKNFEMRHSN